MDSADELLKILDLETIDENLYRGQNDSVHRQRLFGGQVLAQSVAAACRTADRPCHSAHAYFLRPGIPDTPVLYRVERIREGRSFMTRRIVAQQNGAAIFSMDASFQSDEAGLEHQIPLGEFPAPTDLEDDVAVHRRRGVTNPWMLRDRPFECRSTIQLGDATKPRSDNPVWIRFRSRVPNSPPLHQQLLAYGSDMGFVGTAFLPHQASHDRDDIQSASLDHALWFHRPVDVNEWLLFTRQTTNGESARGFIRGGFYTKEGVLVASAMQEGLIRVRR